MGADVPRRDPRDVLDGVLWVLRTGAPWKDLLPALSALSDLPSSVLAVVPRGDD